MATLATLETRVLNTLGDPNRRRWATSDYSTEIQDLLIEGTRIISALVVRDALVDLLKYQQTVMAGGNTISAPDDLLFPLNLWATESDGDFGRPWDYYSRPAFQQKIYDENELAQDSTNTRIWTALPLEASVANLDPNEEINYELYPTPVSGRTVRIEYVGQPTTTSGNMTSPLILQAAVVAYAISIAATKKSFDLDMADRYEKKWRQGVADVNSKFINVHGMTSAVVGQVVNTMGW